MATVEDYNGRVLFDGIEDDATAYVEQHFPHHHNEPGHPSAGDEPTADVVMVDDADVTHAFVGGKWSEVDYEVKGGRFQVPKKKEPPKKTTVPEKK